MSHRTTVVCDRCGTEWDREVQSTYDLCPSCVDQPVTCIVCYKKITPDDIVVYLGHGRVRHVGCSDA